MVQLERCDDLKRVTRSQLKEPKNASTPAKRSHRCLTIDERPNGRGKRNVLISPEPIKPAKRNVRSKTLDERPKGGNQRALNSAAQKSKPAKSIRQTKDNDNTLSDLVATNCKLANEMMTMKKQLFQKTDQLLQMQEQHHKLLEIFRNVESENQRLTKEVGDLRSQLFCDDLINLNADPTCKFLQSNLILCKQNTNRIERCMYVLITKYITNLIERC